MADKPKQPTPAPKPKPEMLGTGTAQKAGSAIQKHESLQKARLDKVFKDAGWEK